MLSLVTDLRQDFYPKGNCDASFLSSSYMRTYSHSHAVLTITKAFQAEVQRLLYTSFQQQLVSKLGGSLDADTCHI